MGMRKHHRRLLLRTRISKEQEPSCSSHRTLTRGVVVNSYETLEECRNPSGELEHASIRDFDVYLYIAGNLPLGVPAPRLASNLEVCGYFSLLLSAFF